MDRSIAEGPGPENGASAPTTLLVLDFDGVICDSLPECYVSSWRAYHGRPAGAMPSMDPQGAWGRFRANRPYVRTGEDYLLLQHAECQGLTIPDQETFDELSRRAGPETLRGYRRRLYETRDAMVADEIETWLDLNPPYGHMGDLVRRLDPSRGVMVLSTKRSDLVVRILRRLGSALPPSSVLEPSGSGKLYQVKDLVRDRGASGALFVDDQVDYFRDAATRAPEVDCRLAAWGYVRPSWLVPSADYRVLEATEARTLLLRWCLPA